MNEKKTKKPGEAIFSSKGYDHASLYSYCHEMR